MIKIRSKHKLLQHRQVLADDGCNGWFQSFLHVHRVLAAFQVVNESLLHLVALHIVPSS